MTNITNEYVKAEIIYGANEGEATGETLFIYNNYPHDAEHIANQLKTALENDYGLLTIGNYSVVVNKVYMVFDRVNEKRYVVNEDNKLPSLEPEFLNTLADEKLFGTVRDMTELLSQLHPDEEADELDAFTEVQDDALDIIEERYYEQQVENSHLRTLLSHFVFDNGLERLFNKYIDGLKERSKDDEFNIIETSYGENVERYKDLVIE